MQIIEALCLQGRNKGRERQPKWHRDADHGFMGFIHCPGILYCPGIYVLPRYLYRGKMAAKNYYCVCKMIIPSGKRILYFEER